MISCSTSSNNCLLFVPYSVVGFSRYPTRDQLTAVAELIVRTYPALKDQSVGMGHVGSFTFIFYSVLQLETTRCLVVYCNQRRHISTFVLKK